MTRKKTNKKTKWIKQADIVAVEASGNQLETTKKKILFFSLDG